MSTVVVARKGDTLAIASDSPLTCCETRPARCDQANRQLFDVAGTFIGRIGNTAQFPVQQQTLARLPDDRRLVHSRQVIFESSMRLHPKLTQRLFLTTKKHASDPLASSQFSIVLANRHGRWGSEPGREVCQFQRFRAIGSVRRPAPGAMHGSEKGSKSARDVAEAGVLAGCEFRHRFSRARAAAHLQVESQG